MGRHDDYGKRLFSQLLGGRWSASSDYRRVDEGGVRADLDGVIWSSDSDSVCCAVEIEAKIYKQIRGAIVDLAIHTAPKKLLVILNNAQPQLGSEDKTLTHCNYVWKQIGKGHGTFRAVCLLGTGYNPELEEDLARLSAALADLQISVG